MPCSTDGYAPPTKHQRGLKKTAQIYVLLLILMGKKVPTDVRLASREPYGRVDFAPKMCKMISKMDEKTLNRVVYDGRNANSRKIADWWEKHQAIDKERRAREKEEAKKIELAQKALDKLTKAEAHALILAIREDRFEDIGLDSEDFEDDDEPDAPRKPANRITKKPRLKPGHRC